MHMLTAAMSISFLYHVGSMTLIWHMAHTEKTFTKKIEY